MPNIGNDFANRYFRVVSENERLRAALGDRGRRAREPFVPRATTTIPTDIPVETLTALTTYNPGVYGDILVQRFPANIQIISSSTALRVAAGSVITKDNLTSYQPGIFTSAVQRRPGYGTPTIPGIPRGRYNARNAIISRLPPNIREIIRKLEDLKALTDLVQKFVNFARQLELIIQAGANFISAYLTNPLLRKEAEISAVIAKLQENERKYLLIKRLVQLLIKAYRATKAALIKIFVTDGPKAIEAIKKGYSVLQKLLSLPEIPRLRLVLKWPRFPRIWLTIVDFFARFRRLIDGLKKTYSKIYKAAYIAAVKQAGFEIADPNDPILRAFSGAKNALREARANVQAVRNSIERGISQAENKLKQNIRSTVKNVLDEQERALSKYNNLKLSSSLAEATASVGVLDATRALRGTVGDILTGINAYNDVVNAFGGSPKSLINSQLLNEARRVVSFTEAEEVRYGVKPVKAQDSTTINGDEITTTATALDASIAISRASAENRREAERRGYNRAVTFQSQPNLQEVDVNGQIQWKATVTNSWVFVIEGYQFGSTDSELPLYVMKAIAAGIVAGTVFPALLLAAYNLTQKRIGEALSAGNGTVAYQPPIFDLNTSNIVRDSLNPLNIQPPIHKVSSNSARLRKDPSIPPRPNSDKTVIQGGNIIRTLQQNTELELMVGDFITASGVTWAKVRLRGYTPGNPLSEGWISTSLLTPRPQPFKPQTQAAPPVSTPISEPVAFSSTGGFVFSEQFKTELTQETGVPVVPDIVSRNKVLVSPANNLTSTPAEYKEVIRVEVVRPATGNSSQAAWRIAQNVANLLQSTNLLNKNESNDLPTIQGQQVKKTILTVEYKSRQEVTPLVVADNGIVGGNQIFAAIFKPKSNDVKFREAASTSARILKSLTTTTELRIVSAREESDRPVVTENSAQFVDANGYKWAKFEILQTKERGWVAISLLTPTINFTGQVTTTSQSTSTRPPTPIIPRPAQISASTRIALSSEETFGLFIASITNSGNEQLIREVSELTNVLREDLYAGKFNVQDIYQTALQRAPVLVPPTTQNNFSTTQYFVNSNNGAYIRSTPSISSTNRKLLRNNTQLKLFVDINSPITRADNYSWAKFQVANDPTTEGWVAISLVRPTVPTTGVGAPPTSGAPASTTAQASTQPASPASTQPVGLVVLQIPTWLLAVTNINQTTGLLTNTTALVDALKPISLQELVNRYQVLERLIAAAERNGDVRRNGLLQARGIVAEELVEKNPTALPPSTPQDSYGTGRTATGTVVTTPPPAQPSTGSGRVLLVGDSITTEFWTNTRKSPPETVRTSTWGVQYKDRNTNLNVEILAEGGKRLTDWMKLALTNKLQAGSKYNKIVIYGGVNDMFAAPTPQEAFNALQQMVNEATATGAKVFVVTGYDTPNDMDENILSTQDTQRRSAAFFLGLKNKYIQYQQLIQGIRGATIIPAIRLGKLRDGVHPSGSQVTTLLNHISSFINR